jgi:putative redox protein
MTPPELLLASLGSCVGYYAAQYLRKRRLAAEGTRVCVRCQKVQDPVPRLSDFVIEVDARLDQRQGLEQAVGHCLVHNTLLHTCKISLSVRGPALAAKN